MNTDTAPPIDLATTANEAHWKSIAPRWPQRARGYLKYFLQDWDANPHDLRMRLVLAAFRIGQRTARQTGFIRVLVKPYNFAYRMIIHNVFHIELHQNTEVGEGLRIFHGYCLVINPHCRIGKRVTLRHCVTLGNKGHSSADAPVLEDDVEVGSNAVIIGPVTIGAHSAVGAGAVVTKSVPPGSIVVGNPAKVIRTKSL